MGRIRVTGGGNSATATITRHGRDATRLSVESGSVRGRESLRIVYPSERISMSDDRQHRTRLELRVRSDGTFGSDEYSSSRGGYSRGGYSRDNGRDNDGTRMAATQVATTAADALPNARTMPSVR